MKSEVIDQLGHILLGGLVVGFSHLAFRFVDSYHVAFAIAFVVSCAREYSQHHESPGKLLTAGSMRDTFFCSLGGCAAYELLIK